MRLILLFSGWLLASVALADIVRVGTFHIPLLVESAEHGLFIDVAKAVAEKAGAELQIEIFPTQRTREAFASGRLDGLFPALADSMTSVYSATEAFSTKRVYGFTRASDPLVRSAADLAGKRIGYTEGFTYSPLLLSAAGASYQATQTDPQNILKLLAGRIDVFLCDEVSALASIREYDAAGRLHYDHRSPLAEYPIFFAFQRDARGRELARRFSDAIHALKESGEMARLLKTNSPLAGSESAAAHLTAGD